MEISSVKKGSVMLSVVCALFLLTMTIGTNKTFADTVNHQTIKGTQVAWWGGYHHRGGYYRPYHRYYYRPTYWGGPRYHYRCPKYCRNTRWGVRCWRRC